MKWMEQRNTLAKYKSQPNSDESTHAVPDYIPKLVAAMKPSKKDRLSAYDPRNEDSMKVRAGKVGSHEELLKYPKIAELFRSLPCNCTFY